MKPLLSILSFAAALFFYSCQSAETNPQLKSATDTIKFFPVTSFLQTQLIAIDSLPVTIMYVVTENSKSDTSWIKKNQRDSILKTFLVEEIKQDNLTDFFKESTFKDETINAITLTYDAFGKIPDSIHIRHWDVYIDPDKGKVKKIYIEKEFLKEGIQQHLIWQSDQFAKIITLKATEKNKLTVVKEEKIVWDFSK